MQPVETLLVRAGPRRSRWAQWAPAVMVLGAALRIRQFLVDRSLWVDEALLAQNIVDRDLRGLIEPLDGEQGAPVGYLWLLRVLVVAFEPTERWMRLPSLVAGIVLLPLVWALAKRLLPPSAALVATLLVAISPGLVRYSVELKQYAIDVVLAVALVLLAHMVEQRRSYRATLALAAFGMGAVWLSHAAVLVLPGIGLYLFIRAASWRDAVLVRALGLTGLAWGTMLAALYTVSLRDLTENEFLTGYWRAGFPAEPYRPDRLLAWLWSSLVDLLAGVGGHRLPELAVLACIVAAGGLVVSGRAGHLALLLTFLPALVVAASLEKYPFRDRLALFTLPFVLVVLASLLAQGSHRRRLVAGGVLAVLSLGPVSETLHEAIDPTRFPEARVVVDFVARNHAPDQDILVHKLAVAPFAFYRSLHSLPSARVLRWRSADRCLEEPPGPPGQGETWVIFAYTHSSSPADEAEILRSQLDAMGRRLSFVEAHDAFAALYDFDALPTDPGGVHRRATPSTACVYARPA